MPSPQSVLANAMWRTGSTYLASRFAASPAYMMFYEPDHEGVGRVIPIPSIARRRRPTFGDLNHPDLGRSYFDAYHAFDPQTGRPLPWFQPSSAALKDVYNDASDRMIGFLRACERVARHQGRTPFFGFCRSGTQHVRIDAELGGDPIYLWRDPHEQFASYDWPKNDYFIPGTLAQLLMSRNLRPVTTELLAELNLARAARFIALAEKINVRSALRLARRACRNLNEEQAYALFYTSWLVSVASGKESATVSFSINELIADALLRRQIEERFAIELQGARSTERPVPDLGYAQIEKRVEKILAGHDRLVTAPRLRKAGQPTARTQSSLQDPST